MNYRVSTAGKVSSQGQSHSRRTQVRRSHRMTMANYMQATAVL